MPLPTFSVIIPTCNRPESLRRCVAGILQSEYPKDRIEILVVDDGSQTPVEGLSGEGISLRVLRQTNAGPAAARNLGSQHAQGEMLAFTDDDCVPSSRWIPELASALAANADSLVGGNTQNALPQNCYSVASQLICNEAQTYFRVRNSPLRFFASNNIAVEAGRFRKIGGFDPAFRTSEDRDLCTRWIHNIGPLVSADHACVAHYHQLSLSRYWRQHFHYGQGAYRFYQTHRSRQKLSPSIRFYGTVWHRMMSSTQCRNSVVMAALFAIWQVANLAGFLWAALNRNRSK